MNNTASFKVAADSAGAPCKNWTAQDLSNLSSSSSNPSISKGNCVWAPHHGEDRSCAAVPAHPSYQRICACGRRSDDVAYSFSSSNPDALQRFFVDMLETDVKMVLAQSVLMLLLTNIGDKLGKIAFDTLLMEDNPNKFYVLLLSVHTGTRGYLTLIWRVLAMFSLINEYIPEVWRVGSLKLFAHHSDINANSNHSSSSGSNSMGSNAVTGLVGSMMPSKMSRIENSHKFLTHLSIQEVIILVALVHNFAIIRCVPGALRRIVEDYCAENELTYFGTAQGSCSLRLHTHAARADRVVLKYEGVCNRVGL